MKIAVTTENGKTFGHFGKCKCFTIFEAEGTQVISKKEVDTFLCHNFI